MIDFNLKMVSLGHLITLLQLQLKVAKITQARVHHSRIAPNSCIGSGSRVKDVVRGIIRWQLDRVSVQTSRTTRLGRRGII